MKNRECRVSGFRISEPWSLGFRFSGLWSLGFRVSELWSSGLGFQGFGVLGF